MINLLRGLRIYIRLTRWEDYATFLQFVFGFFLAKNFQVSTSDLILLGKTLFVLAPLLYGGIYTLNNLKDAELDKLNPKKKDRPIPAGEVSKEQASWIALILIGTGLLFSLFLPPAVFPMALVFLIANIIYTFWAKNVPYVELIANTITHVFRLLFGMWLAGNLQYGYLAIVLGIASFAASVFRRTKELKEGVAAARPVLRFYTPKKLWTIFWVDLAVLALFVSLGRPWERVIGALFLLSHLIYGIGYFRSEKIKKIIDFAWR